MRIDCGFSVTSLRAPEVEKRHRWKRPVLANFFLEPLWTWNTEITGGSMQQTHGIQK